MDVEAARDGLWEIDEDAFEGFGPETNNNKGDLAIEAPRKGANRSEERRVGKECVP